MPVFDYLDGLAPNTRKFVIRNDLNDNGLQSSGELRWVRSSVLRPCDTNAIIPLGEFSSMVVRAQHGITSSNLGELGNVPQTTLRDGLIDDVPIPYYLKN
ncbi:hypothetical protein HN011_012133 [Eciton burchellii]|jgi:hypothetical protein|nr:hypothetical protein HN011_012133 [Eciton burchellii]